VRGDAVRNNEPQLLVSLWLEQGIGQVAQEIACGCETPSLPETEDMAYTGGVAGGDLHAQVPGADQNGLRRQSEGL